jgi:hypothetical protein
MKRKHPEPIIGELTGSIMPMLNINGTDPETLLEQHKQALDAYDRAVDMITGARNGRDYQSLSLEMNNKAAVEYSHYSARLVGAREYLIDVIDTISAYIDQRNAMRRGVVLHVRKPSPEEPIE